MNQKATGDMTWWRGSTATLACFCVLLTGHLGQQVDTNMESIPTITPTINVHPSRQSLNAGEREFVLNRKQVVLESLGRLNINCTADSVPHIALLASGGGQRAAVGLLGFLHQMGEDDLLDTLLYLGGVSGSTWALASLYSHPQWSTNMELVLSQLSAPGPGFEEAQAWLNKRSQEEHFSLSDIWGLVTSAFYMKQMDLRRLSEEASRNVTNPYPVYSAIEKHCFCDGPIEAQWFEVTPHEAGFTELGLYVQTSHLGSRFQGGELREQMPEMDMIQLQGLLGCAVAYEETFKDLLPSWLNVTGAEIEGSVQQYLHVYYTLDRILVLLRSSLKDPDALSKLDALEKILEENLKQTRAMLLDKHTQSTSANEAFFQQRSLELASAIETWSQTLEDGPFKRNVNWLTKDILPLVVKWEWGTTTSFLYKYNDSQVPHCLHSEDVFHLIDAGLVINVPYPPFLGDKRDIDLIIAPEFSAGDMFETLTLARDYAAKLNKPFPVIEDKILEEKDWPKDCYVFPGESGRPTIVFMPLFNRNNCADVEEVRAKMHEYSTFQLPFTQEKTESLLEVAKANMKRNTDIILREIQNAAVRRHNRRNMAEPDPDT